VEALETLEAELAALVGLVAVGWSAPSAPFPVVTATGWNRNHPKP
jgi:hypothetical protein